MKKLILLALFIVSWNQWELKPHFDPNRFGVQLNPSWYTIEETTHTIKLAKQEDVNRFVGYHETNELSYIEHPGIIPEHAFNIKISQEDSDKIGGCGQANESPCEWEKKKP